MPERVVKALAVAMFRVASQRDDEIRQLKQKIQRLEMANQSLRNEVSRSQRDLDDQIFRNECLKAQLQISEQSLYRVLVGQ